MDFWGRFDKVFVINLESRADRRAEMDQQLRRVGLSLGSEKVQLFSAVRPEKAGEFPSIGARGCFMSHLGVLRQALSAGDQTIAILEDDVNFVAGFEAHSRAIARALQQSDWALFYGGYRLEGPALQGPCSPVAAATSIGTSHFIGVRGVGVMRSLAQYMEAQLSRKAGDAEGGPMHVDGTYSWFRKEHPELTTLLAVPEIAVQRASRSDIHAGTVLDRLWGSRQMMAAARRFKNRLA